MSDRVYAVDYETYYDAGYSLSEMSTYQYVTDPRFDCYLVAIHGADLHWVGHPKDAPWDKIDGAVWLMHNMSFDAVVTWRLKELGVIPSHINWSKLYDTADMAAYIGAPRALNKACKALLDRDVSKAVRSDMKGKTYQDMIDLGREAEIVEYGGSDAENTYDLWMESNHLWPEAEREISRLNFESCQYGFMVDADYARGCVADMKQQRYAALEQIPWAVHGLKFLQDKHPDQDVDWEFYLASKDKSKNKETGKQNIYPPLSPAAVRAQGVADGIKVPASIAKTSEEWTGIIKKKGEELPWLKAVGHYRSLNAHYNKAKNVVGGIRTDGSFALQIKYFGASTGRFSGGTTGDEGGKFNPQNMPQQEMFGCDIRHFFIPRQYKTLCCVDYSQIEARVLMWIAGDTELAEAVKKEGNLYQAYARKKGIYTGTGSFKKDDPEGYRNTKGIALGLGYMMSAVRYMDIIIPFGMLVEELKRGMEETAGMTPKQASAYALQALVNAGYSEKYAAQLNTKIKPFKVYALMKAQEGVTDYRQSNPKVVQHWASHQKYLEQSAKGSDDTHEVVLHSGRVLTYYNPHMEGPRDIKAQVEIGGRPYFLHAGVLTNNEVQATSRDILCDAWRACDRAGKRVLLSVHDELVFEVSKTRAEQEKDEICEIMLNASPWAEGCPLGVEAELLTHYTK